MKRSTEDKLYTLAWSVVLIALIFLFSGCSWLHSGSKLDAAIECTTSCSKCEQVDTMCKVSKDTEETGDSKAITGGK